MRNNNPKRSLFTPILRTLLETSFIIFLFYANLLMGEYEKTGNGQRKGALWALNDIITINNFIIAIVAAIIGYFVFEFLRKKI
jgi:hypothetical protein